MIPNFTEKHAETSLLRFIFAYIEFIDLQEPAYKTGRPRISRKIMLKCFLLQAYFGIASLRKLVDFLKAGSYWRCTFDKNISYIVP
ncbi:transposase [Aneurinibacillus thermoaerophilus]|jgi:transposase|uniref:transposase n=1 Tax=Aneurinibacillus thermoaerophilus TaxID=143495 RepID=UPI00399D2DF7